ncbi:LOW QUALITY PROTEIN: hypothetical protein U9M48_042260, partial [Paspalum notatum var. saurae]
MPTYHLFVFPLVAWARKRIDKIRRSFLCKDKAETNGGHGLPLVSKPKALGSLGIINLEKSGHALRLRWLWRDWMDDYHSWLGQDAPCDRTDRLLFSASTSVSIGDGKKAKFWHDSWLDGMAPRNLAPHLFDLVARKNKTPLSSMEMAGSTRNAIEIMEFVSLWAMIQDVHLQPKTLDSIVWKWTPDGVFSIKSAYRAQFLGSYRHLNADFIWKAQAEPKRKLFSWILLQNKILIADNLAARDWWRRAAASFPKDQKHDFNGTVSPLCEVAMSPKLGPKLSNALPERQVDGAAAELREVLKRMKKPIRLRRDDVTTM